VRILGIIILTLAIGLVVLAAWLRLGNFRRQKRLTRDAQDTFLSNEIKNVVANAGGIYISLSLAASFLQLNLSKEFALWGLEFDIVAALSLILAFLQPLIWPKGN
jgi:DMSO reductase anchor subunit